MLGLDYNLTAKVFGFGLKTLGFSLEAT